MRTPALILIALLAAACSSGGTETPPAPSTPTTTTTTSAVAGAGRCQEVAQEDQRVTDTLIDKGCADDNGSLRFGKITLCEDGRRLWEMNDLIGFSGEPILPRETKAEGGIPAWTLYYPGVQGVARTASTPPAPTAGELRPFARATRGDGGGATRRRTSAGARTQMASA